MGVQTLAGTNQKSYQAFNIKVSTKIAEKTSNLNPPPPLNSTQRWTHTDFLLNSIAKRIIIYNQNNRRPFLKVTTQKTENSEKQIT